MENILVIITVSGLVYLMVNSLSKRFSLASKMVNPSIYYKKVEDGYATLVNYLYHNSDKKELEAVIKKMILRRADGRYIGGYSKNSNDFDWTSFTLDIFYDLVRYDEIQKIDFIFDLEKNVSVEKLNKFFKHLLEDEVVLNYVSTQEQFPYKDVLVSYQKALNGHKIQLAFFTDSSGSYYLLLFPLNKEKVIKEAIANIGFEYKSELSVI